MSCSSPIIWFAILAAIAACLFRASLALFVSLAARFVLCSAVAACLAEHRFILVSAPGNFDELPVEAAHENDRRLQTELSQAKEPG
jgi:hypothetical protein